MMLADSGRITRKSGTSNLGRSHSRPCSISLILCSQRRASPVVLVAASSATAGWKRRPVEVSVGGQAFVAQTAPRKSILGRSADDFAGRRAVLGRYCQCGERPAD